MRAVSMALSAVTALIIGTAVAGDAATAGTGVGLELNKLEPEKDGCRLYMLFKNETAHDFTAFKMDVVVFDGDGIVDRRIALDAAPLNQGRTVLKTYPVAGMGCESIGSLLLNDVYECSDANGAVPDCSGLARPSSRAAVEFKK